MKTTQLVLLAGLLGLAGLVQTHGAPFNSGSTEALGDLVITNDTVLEMPPDGVFNCKSFQIVSNAYLSFHRNPLNTPVYILASGDILIDGRIDVSGGGGSAANGGLGGPGGFNGGKPGSGDIPPGAGFGPGGGKGGTGFDSNRPDSAGSGTYKAVSVYSGSTRKGAPYGTPVLIPLVGGSGGGGTFGVPGVGGGGGGGALLIASSTKIAFGASAQLISVGGPRTVDFNGGSGGAVRVVAPTIVGTVNASVQGHANTAGLGRVRVDTLDASATGFTVSPPDALSVGALMATGLANAPKLDILGAAGTSIAEGNPTPVSVLLPNGSSINQMVTVQAKNFGTKVPINVVLTPDYGDPVVFPAEIDNTTKNPATVDIPIVLPINVPIAINVWTR